MKVVLKAYTPIDMASLFEKVFIYEVSFYSRFLNPVSLSIIAELHDIGR